MSYAKRSLPVTWIVTFGLLLGIGSRAIGQEPCSGGGEPELACWFDRGLEKQEQADASKEPELKTLHLTSAASFYERALRLDPKRGNVLNNLAQLYADLGRDPDAERTFQQATALEVPLRPFFLRNYGVFLESRGDWDRAAKEYRKALELRPQEYPAHDRLVAILSQHRPEALGEYLWFLVGQGQTSWAEDAVLATWGEKRVPRDQNEEFLALLVACMAAQPFQPENFPSNRAAVLTSMSDESDIGEGAQEVQAVIKGADFTPEKYSWWAERGRPAGATGNEPSPREAFRRLLRSLGDVLHANGRYDEARSYFRLAILLTQDESDLLAFRKLVNLPSSQEDVAAIDRLVDGNEKVILKTSPKQADLSLYRHDLGLFYGFLRHWNGDGPASGIYQLSQATSMGGVGPPDGPPDTPTFDARIYTRLAAGYTDTRRPERSIRALFDLVAAYRSHDMNDEADAMLAMLKAGRSRYRPLDRRREPFDDPPFSLRDFTTQPPGPP